MAFYLPATVEWLPTNKYIFINISSYSNSVTLQQAVFQEYYYIDYIVGGGPGITNNGTGCQGAESFRSDPNRGSTAGTDYMAASQGGKGYTILWFHN
jgi:hypothetical protein